MIQVHGFQKLTLLDYPGRLACTIFLGSCNFRCPFCQNSGLVLAPEQEPTVPLEGEPTVSRELPEIVKEIKKLGYAVKLDTNGTNPGMVKTMVEKGLLDYVAMDIKNSPEKYRETAGVENINLEAVCETVEFLKSGKIEYEFRTTVTRELHKKEDFLKIRKWLSGSRRYFLQAYQESEQVIRPIYSSYSKEQLENFRQLLLEEIEQVELRGV